MANKEPFQMKHVAPPGSLVLPMEILQYIQFYTSKIRVSVELQAEAKYPLHTTQSAELKWK